MRPIEFAPTEILVGVVVIEAAANEVLVATCTGGKLGQCVRNLQIHMANKTKVGKRIGRVATQCDLQCVVHRPANREVHDVLSNQRICSGKGCALIRWDADRVGRRTEELG